MPMMEDIYQDRLLDLAADIPMAEPLEDADARASASSPTCGSHISVEVKVEGNRLVAYAQDVDACALGSASASIFARAAVGRPLDEIRSVRDMVFNMLSEDGPAPTGVWSDFALLRPARVLGNRHRSMMLCLDATVEALGRVSSGSADSALGRRSS